MAAPVPETSTPEEIPDLEENAAGHAERAQWVLNAPEPPSPLRELIDSVRDTVFPCGNNFLSLKNQPRPEHVVSFFQGLFPILVWSRTYTATKFKNDLLAGLTIASLCIPQVNQGPRCRAGFNQTRFNKNVISRVFQRHQTRDT
jgi:low affinity sulfate transporter 2